MLPQNKFYFQSFRCKEAAKAGYPGGMSMFGKGIVESGTKEIVIDFFSSDKFKVPSKNNFTQMHSLICDELSKKIESKLNKKRKKLQKKTIAAKFLDAFLYQLLKFEEYQYLRPKLNLIIDTTILPKIRKYNFKKLQQALENYPTSAYEATYEQYQKLQVSISSFINDINNRFIKNKIDLNYLWGM